MRRCTARATSSTPWPRRGALPRTRATRSGCRCGPAGRASAAPGARPRLPAPRGPTALPNRQTNQNQKKHPKNRSRSSQVYPYSIFHVFFEQYLNTAHDAGVLLGLPLAAVFAIAWAFTGAAARGSASTAAGPRRQSRAAAAAAPLAARPACPAHTNTIRPSPPKKQAACGGLSSCWACCCPCWCSSAARCGSRVGARRPARAALGAPRSAAAAAACPPVTQTRRPGKPKLNQSIHAHTKKASR